MKLKEIKTIFNAEIINNLIEKKLNNVEIAKVLKINSRRVSDLLKYLGIKNPNTGYLKKVNHDYFDIIDTEKKAYILGFIIGDGCISIEPKKKNGEIYSYSKRLIFSQSIDDKEILEHIRSEISKDSIFKEILNLKGAKNRKPQLSLRISSIEIINKLISYGIKPNKTKDIDFSFDWNIVPDHLKHHFIRGLIDSDGWFSIRKSNAKKHINNKTFLILGFVCTSEQFAKEIQKELEKNLNVNISIRSEKSKNMILYRLSSYIGEDFNILKNYLYKDATIFLNRKFQKLFKQ